MFLHVAHASRSGHERIAIKSSDTDVEVLACFYSINMPSQLFLESGTQARARIIDVTKVCDSLGSATCRALPGLHALTGCDSVSSFATKGKKKAFDIVQGNQVFRESVEILGERIPMANFDQLEQFVCALYNDAKCHSVNDLRYKMFCKGKHLQSHQLPPSRSALINHIKRANFQAYIWKHALEQNVNVTPNGQGWRMNNSCLEIDWTDQPPAADAVMALVCCGCKGQCKTRRCSCVVNKLPCTEACACEHCENTFADGDASDEDENDNDD